MSLNNVKTVLASGILIMSATPAWATVIPEPSSFALLGVGAASVIFLARRRKK
ncbi:MAG: PEP-CTERM sorting domain-containing protein [Rhodospirillaceae bacterium]|jgi:hypothetical protein|nr:PEP-CTERM sorting domain-containing protein [Rhodospirillaceae bacterium]